MLTPSAVHGSRSTYRHVHSEGEWSESVSLTVPVEPLDTLAYWEGFCPNCLVPLRGDCLNWCPRCQAFWNHAPASEEPHDLVHLEAVQ